MQGLQYNTFGEIDVLELTMTDIPEPGPDEVLVQVLAASINPFDWKLRRGKLRDHFDPTFPITPGRDGCGRVVALGEEVARDMASLRLGQRVCFITSDLRRGAHAEFVAVKADPFVTPAPSSLSDAACAALPLVSLAAWSAIIDTAQVQEGMRVLVQGGSGGVGAHAIRLAKHIGAQVYATCHSTRAEYVEEMGAVAIPYDTSDFSRAVRDCDVVFDTVGGEVHEKSYAVIKEGGCLAYLNAAPFRAPLSQTTIVARQVNVAASMCNLHRVMTLADEHILHPNVGVVSPITAFERAFRIAEGGSARGKIVIQNEEHRHEQ